MLKSANPNILFFAITIMLFFYPHPSLCQQKINLYRSNVHAFSIIFPDGWKQREGQAPHTIVVSENSENASIIVQVFQGNREASLEDVSDEGIRDLIDSSFTQLKKNMFPDAVMETSGTTYIANNKAIWMRYTYTIKHFIYTEKVSSLLISVVHRNKIFQFTCSSPENRYNDYFKIFSTVIRSIVFEDSSVSESSQEKPSGPNWLYPENPKWLYGEGPGTSPKEMPDNLNSQTKRRKSAPNAWGISTPE